MEELIEIRAIQTITQDLIVDDLITLLLETIEVTLTKEGHLLVEVLLQEEVLDQEDKFFILKNFKNEF